MIPSKPTEEVPAPVAVAPVFEPAVVVEVAKLVAVVEEVQPAVVVESENKLSGPTGTTKKSFLDVSTLIAFDDFFFLIFFSSGQALKANQ